MSAMKKIHELMVGKYLRHGDLVLVVEAVYGHKLLCYPIDQEDPGCCTEDVVVIETSHGMVLLNEDPLAEVKTDDEDEPAGPTAREFLFAIQKLDSNGEKDITLHRIATYLGYEYDPVQKRAARLVKEIPIGLLRVIRRGRAGNVYEPIAPVAISRWLKGNG